MEDLISSSTPTHFQPRYFKREIFLGNTTDKSSSSSSAFDVNLFIADCKQRAPIESVLSDLKDFTVTLESELLEIINKDYTDFVNLSSNLVGIDKTLNDLRNPLLQIGDNISVCTCSQLNSIIDKPSNK